MKPDAITGGTAEWRASSNPGYLFNRATRLLARIGDQRLRPLGFAIGQLPVLVSLKNGEARSQKELTQIAQIEQPSMAQILSRMERDGLIYRISDPNDKRSSLICLTDTARARLPQARAILQRGHHEALAGFSPEEQQTLMALLERVVQNLEGALESNDTEKRA